jgi:fatty acid desaturase
VYARLKADVHAGGILDRSYYYYFAQIVLAFGGYGLSALGIYIFDDPVLLGVSCLGFSFFTAQLAGLMHDSGHRAVFKSTRFNDLLGVASSAAIGLVFANWTARHNAHHAYPNQESKDPDLELPFLAVSELGYRNKPGLQKSVMRWQALYYFPLGGIVSLTNRLGTLSFFLQGGLSRGVWRLLLYLPATFILFALPFFVFSIEKGLFVVILVHLSTGIYLANCFAPNHKGMPVLVRGSSLPFMERQVITSRNVRGGLITDIVLVGLNHQVEHHLFPSCPRNKLSRLQPLIRSACHELGLEFCEEGIWETNAHILRNLHRTSRSQS